MATRKLNRKSFYCGKMHLLIKAGAAATGFNKIARLPVILFVSYSINDGFGIKLWAKGLKMKRITRQAIATREHSVKFSHGVPSGGTHA